MASDTLTAPSVLLVQCVCRSTITQRPVEWTSCHAGVRAGISAKNAGEDADVASWKLHAPARTIGREWTMPVINASDR
jgi:hypothetical protein